MKSLFSIAATAAVVLGGGGAKAAEPTWEVVGFPITLHQISVLGSELRAANLKERAPTPMLTLAGMPASPVQVAVLTPRPHIAQQQVPEEVLEAGLAQVRFVDPSE